MIWGAPGPRSQPSGDKPKDESQPSGDDREQTWDKGCWWHHRAQKQQQLPVPGFLVI